MIPDTALRSTAIRLAEFSREWHQEMPSRIHSGSLDRGGSPQWHPSFSRWMGSVGVAPRVGSNSDGRLRLTNAMRQLRVTAPREYDVIYRVMVLGERLEHTTAWLNDRAIRGGHPERYTFRDTVVLVFSAVDKLAFWF